VNGAAPQDGGAPTLQTQSYAFPGDERMPLAELVVLDVGSGTVVRAETEPLLVPLMSPIWAAWTATSPLQTLRLVERLIAADKDFDLLIVPGAEHLLTGYDGYVQRRQCDFLVRHLMGLEPPEVRHFSPVPMELFAELFFG
jgi:hypothetical protein